MSVPKVNYSKLKEEDSLQRGDIVKIFCADNECWLTVDSNLFLVADAVDFRNGQRFKIDFDPSEQGHILLADKPDCGLGHDVIGFRWVARFFNQSDTNKHWASMKIMWSTEKDAKDTTAVFKIRMNDYYFRVTPTRCRFRVCVEGHKKYKPALFHVARDMPTGSLNPTMMTNTTFSPYPTMMTNTTISPYLTMTNTTISPYPTVTNIPVTTNTQTTQATGHPSWDDDD